MRYYDIEKGKEVVSGIYSITNTKTNNTYIGVSKGIHARWKRHIYNLKNGIHPQHRLQEEFAQYKIEDFEFNILETFNNYVESIVKQLEDVYILKYRELGLGFEQKTNVEIAENYKNNIKEKVGKDTRNYFYMNFKEIESLNLDDQTLFRLLFIASNMNYKNVIKKENNNKVMATKKDIGDMLKIGRVKQIETLKVLFDKNILYMDNEVIRISGKIFQRNTIYSNKSNYVKVYMKVLYNLYNSSNANEHKGMGGIIKLLPYCHKNTNILCENIKEKNYEKINPFNKRDLLEALSRKNNNISFFKDVLLRADGYNLKNVYMINPDFICRDYLKDEINLTIKNNQGGENI